MRIRLASVAFEQRHLTAFAEFHTALRQHVLFAADCGAQLIVFPEYVTSSLLNINNDWNAWTSAYQECLQQLATEFKIYIQGGTHLCLDKSNHWVNAAFFVNPTGAIQQQNKMHLTPVEKSPWELKVGEGLKIFHTQIGKIAILTCYDIEFPIAAQAAARAGADILLVPSFTDDRAGYYRVSLCARARCIENQLYVVQAPLIGNLESVRYFEQAFGKANIFTPCDIAFPAAGVLAEGEFNEEICVVGEIDLGLLHEIRECGSVTPIKDAKPVEHYTTHLTNF